MTKVLDCGEVVEGCTFKAEGATEAEVLQQAAEHAKHHHGVELSDDVAGKIKETVEAD